VNVRERKATYEFTRAFQDKVYNPNEFAEIALRMQRVFRSEHALALYENTRRFLMSGETPWIPRPRLERLDGSGRSMFVLFDSCYSGAAVKRKCSSGRVFSRANNTARLILADDSGCQGGGEDLELTFFEGTRPKAEPYPYANILFISATSDSQGAEDIDSGYRQRHALER
jgi:hypothetical protein